MDSTNISDLWDRVIGTQPDPDWLVIVTALVALAAVRAARPVAADPQRRDHRPRGRARPRRPAQRAPPGRHPAALGHLGLTVSRGKPHRHRHGPDGRRRLHRPPAARPGRRLAAGRGAHHALLWGATVLLVAMLVMIRNAYGVLTVLVTGGAFLLVSWLTERPGAGRLRLRRGVVPAPRRRTAGLRTAGQAAARRRAPTPTPTSSPGSRTCRPPCGCSSSTRSRCARSSAAAAGCSGL